MYSHTSWYSPRGSYTLNRPRAMTRAPSSGVNFNRRNDERNMTPFSCACASLSVKYMWPVFHTRAPESSPSTHTSWNSDSTIVRSVAVNSPTVSTRRVGAGGSVGGSGSSKGRPLRVTARTSQRAAPGGRGRPPTG